MNFELSKEQKEVVQAARKFARGEFPDRARDFDREESFDVTLRKKACDLGFVGVFIDTEYDGAGYGLLEQALICEEFFAVDPGIGLAVLSASFGAELVQVFGTEDQKREVLPKIAAGEAVIGTAITEPDAGSDVTSASTTAVRDGDDWVVNGTKMFITNGVSADYILVFCQTDPEHESRHQRHSFLMVPTGTAGYSATKIRGKLGIRASETAEVVLKDVRVPGHRLVGTAGAGFKQLMTFFNMTRIGVCSQAVGVARGALEEAVRHVKGRQQFGTPLASFQATQFKLAEMATRIRAARNLYYEAAWQADNGKLDHSLVAMAKWFAGKVAVDCADEALQMHGGYGYIDEYKVQRLYRDAKIMEIYEGTKEVEKLIVARSLLC